MNALNSVGFRNAFDLLNTYSGNASDLKPWLADAQINTDKNLRLQYVAGMVNNLQIADQIYRAMVKYRTFPEGIFDGNGEAMQKLKAEFAPK